MMYAEADVHMGEGVSQMWTIADKGEGVKNYQIFADVLSVRPQSSTSTVTS